MPRSGAHPCWSWPGSCGSWTTGGSSPPPPSPPEVLAELRLLDEQGRWGSTFARRDRLRLAIAAGEVGEGMDHRDWGLWWALVEELDRIEAVEALTR